jgi:hypothetical protein
VQPASSAKEFIVQDPVIQWVAQKFYERPLQPNELQVARKILYGALILVLFTTTFFWRQVVEAQADQLALREQNRGDVELSGSLVRLTLTGSRGVATCVLWMTAIEKQKKNQWNELEFYVNALTKLQPHFTIPWLFQSWNLSYNVAAESDRWADKYFFITRGIQLLYRGERQNRNNPDLRYSVGFYTEHKICQSDETHVHRSLFQLSCIPPNERDPGRFRIVDSNGKESFNWKEFDDFCRKHPQLIRRLRSGISRGGLHSERVALKLSDSQFRCNKVEDVVNFLAEHWRLPSLYQEALETQPGKNWDPRRADVPQALAERFPVLPPPHIPQAPQRLFELYPGFHELTTGQQDADSILTPLDDNVDGWAVARSWWAYAEEPVPDPDPILPGENQLVRDRVLQRIPKYMATILFRSQPALAQAHQAERLMQEGWFDAEPWNIETWYDSRRKLFEPVEGDSSPSPARLALVQGNAQQAWEAAYRGWETFGIANHLRFRDAAEEVTIQSRAYEFYTSHDMAYGSRVPETPGAMDNRPLLEREQYQAATVVWRQIIYLQMSNYAHHLHRAEVERLPETMQARRWFYRAQRETLASNLEPALQIYRRDDAIKAWIEKVLIPHPLYRKDEFIQEETVDFSLGYQAVYNSFHAPNAFAWATRLQLVFPVGVQGMDQFAMLATAININSPDPQQPKTHITMKGGARILLLTPFDVLLPNDQELPKVVMASVGVGPAGPLMVAPVIASTPLVPLLDPVIVHRVKVEKELIPADKRPATPPGPPPQRTTGPGSQPGAR